MTAPAERIAGFVLNYHGLTIHPPALEPRPGAPELPRLVSLSMRLSEAELADLHSFLATRFPPRRWMLTCGHSCSEEEHALGICPTCKTPFAP